MSVRQKTITPSGLHCYACPLPADALAMRLRERIAPDDAPARTRRQEISPFEGTIGPDRFRVRHRSSGLQTALEGQIESRGAQCVVMVAVSPPAWVTPLIFALTVGLLLGLKDPLLGLGAAIAAGALFFPLDLHSRAEALREFERLLADDSASVAEPSPWLCHRCGEPLPPGETICGLCGERAVI